MKVAPVAAEMVGEEAPTPETAMPMSTVPKSSPGKGKRAEVD
jgi:hypothetical protein